MQSNVSQKVSPFRETSVGRGMISSSSPALPKTKKRHSKSARLSSRKLVSPSSVSNNQLLCGIPPHLLYLPRHFIHFPVTWGYLLTINWLKTNCILSSIEAASLSQQISEGLEVPSVKMTGLSVEELSKENLTLKKDLEVARQLHEGYVNRTMEEFIQLR